VIVCFVDIGGFVDKTNNHVPFQIIEHEQNARTYDDDNPGSVLKQAQSLCRIKLVPL
jgi:hypothetical protein